MSFSILTLNLHSYQEFKTPGDTVAERLKKHEPLFDCIAAAISKLDVDVICLQEVIEGPIDGWQEKSSGQRIDYIFMKGGSQFKVIEARTIFTSTEYGRVSDHAGVFALFSTDD